MSKRIIASFLLACLMLSSASCSSENAADQTVEESSSFDESTAPESTEAATAVPDDLKFDGKTFTMACSDYNQYHHSLVEEMNGEVLNDAMYNMELNTENRLNIAVDEVANNVNTFTQTVQNMVLAGDDAYGAITILDRFDITLMLSNTLAPLQESKYLDLSADYWNPQMANELSIGENTYYAVSSYNILSLVYTSCVYFNSAMSESYGTSPSELYSMVSDGNWTYDKLTGYAENVTADLNGDDKMDDSDRWGITSGDWNVFQTTVLASCGEHALEKNNSNEFYLTWEDEIYGKIAEKAYDIFHSSGSWSKSDRFTCKPFQNGDALFMFGYFYTVADLSEMNDDYGILPPPKYDEAQENYYSETYDSMYTSIPLSASDLDFSGAVLETLSYYGYSEVTDAYIESTMKYKKSRDEKSIEMIQKCLDSRVIDLGCIYLSDYLGYDKFYADLFNKSTFNLSSFIAKNTDKIQAQLDKIIEAANDSRIG